MHRADRIRCRKCGTINNTKRTACRNCGHIIKSKQNICRNIFLVCVSISTIMIVTSILLNTIGDVLSYEMQHTLQNITIHADITAMPTKESSQMESSPTPLLADAQTPSSTKYYANPFEFRNGIRFGMTMDEVKEIETGILEEETDEVALLYKVFIETNDDSLLYVFGDDGLYSITYLFEGSTAPEQCILDLFKVNSGVSLEYGAPTSEDIKWLSDTYMEILPLQLAEGDIIYATRWDLPNVLIMHGLMEDGFRISHILTYIPTYGVDLSSE